jgi:predicted nucleic acid-binding protein
MSKASLKRAVAAGSVLVLDTSAVLAYLDGGEAASSAATDVLDELVQTGRNRALISTVTVTEAMVRPFRLASAPAIATVETFLGMFPNLGVVAIDFAIAREAARVRALTGLATPDCLVISTAIVMGADVIVANDEHWKAALVKLDSPAHLCLLADHADS